MHGGSAVDASAAPPVDCLPADKKMTQQAQQQQAPPASSDDNDSSNTNTNSRRRLEGRVAIVTGGARGIGEAIARLFVAHGARVVIADVADEAAGQAVASSLGPPERCSYERCDVSVEADVERAVRRAVARHGRLDVLCNNAGVLGRQARRSSSILDLDAAEFERVVRVNALGSALGMKHAAGAMLMLKAAGEGGGGGGSIVSVASVMGGMGPHAYTASEHALVGLTKNAARELGRHGIRVNCISPFSVATPMLLDAWRDKLQDKDQEDGAAAAESGSGSGSESESEAATAADEQEEKEVERMEEVIRGLATLKQGATLRASDIAEAALFLASDDSRYVSGHNLLVDGGVTTARNLIGL